VYIPERPATHDTRGHFLHEPIEANDPEFLRAFDQFLRI
jgi:hypothetical protein